MHVRVLQERLDENPLFQRISDEELEGDPAAGLLTEATEEGQKVARNNGEVGSLPATLQGNFWKARGDVCC